MTKGKEPLKKKNSSKKSTVKNNSSKAKRAKKDKLFDFNGIILITLGVLILLALLSVMFSDPTSLAGSMGVFINRIFIGLLGIGAYVLPFVLIYMGVSYIKIDKYLKITKKSLGILIFIVTTMIFVELIVLPAYYVKGNMASAIIDQFKSKSVLHGGIISLIITVPISSLLGKVGSYIVLFALYIISLVLINNITIKELFTFEKVKSKKKSRDLKQTNIAIDEAMEYVSADGNTRDNGSSDESKIKIIDFMKMDEEENRFEGKTETSIEQPNKSKENRNNIEDIDIDISFGDGNKIYAYEHPAPELLHKNLSSLGKNSDKKDLLNSANKLQETLESFGVEAKVIQVTKGPSVTRFELQPHVGVKVSKIVNLADDIALNLAASGVRIEAPIPGKAAVGIEVPNKDLSAVFLREVIESEEFTLTKKNLAFALGKDIAGNCVVGDLSKMPHLLIAGATGSGKSVCINTLLISLLYKYTPQEVKLLLIDPKVVELNIYNGIPHLLIPVVTEPKKAAGALNWAVNEMTRRYKLFADNNVRNIEGYNDFVEKGIIEEKLPWIVIIIDELADLMMVCPNDVEEYIGRLAQMARAAGMHLVIATQRPSVDVITGVIKANIPSRISFAVSSQIDSRTILDSSGAEKLLGKGDMLYYPVGESKPLRIQGAFVSEEEVETVVEFIRNGLKELEYKKEIMDEIENSVSKSKGGEDCDELIDEAIKIVLEEGQASTSLLQRRLKIGYNRAARIIDEMEAEGIISGRNGSKPRQVFGRDDTMRQ
ncbi:MAG: DNA translocase FtsK [Clostridium sulfidigenes]|uniref:DNA translocase FtsK n=1 Tax=Clostridium sulfidigenes TaxID=318464 RepID=A0A927W6V0_9CLOT|nr:DNA translocase FtsK [Clostridium sulfidigenes]